MNKALSKKAVREYKYTVKKVYNIDLLDQDAEIEGLKLLKLFKLIYRVIPKEPGQKI